ncbi:hypothetical protein [Sphingobacterium siyangense]|uniref:hypothetical protein n=1 Tax=Sphingobacterium siyangense TaxID=459529 RepID=UPI003DA239CD
MKSLTDAQKKVIDRLSNVSNSTIKLNEYDKPYSELMQDLGYVDLASKQYAILQAIKYMSVANETLNIDIADFSSVLSSLADIGASLIPWYELTALDELRDSR